MTIKANHSYPKKWDNELPDNMLGSSEGMSFTLDENGEWEESKNYTTIGAKVSITGEITSPCTNLAGQPSSFNIKVASSSGGYSKEHDGIPCNSEVSYDVPTDFGSTKLTLKIYSAFGAADAGLEGHLTISY